MRKKPYGAPGACLMSPNQGEKKTVHKILQNMLFKVLELIFDVLGQKTQNYNSKTEFKQFKQNRGLTVLKYCH